MSIVPIIVIFGFLALVGVAVFLVMKELKKTKNQMAGNINTNNVETAQAFLPFEDVPTNVIDLGNHHYRMIIETSSTNYKLRTPQEQNIIEMTFQEFLNGLTHPITLYVQTRKLDMRKILEHIEEENEKVVLEFPSLENYASNYLGEMNQLESYVGNNIQKKKYVIVPYDEALTMDIPEEEKFALSLKELTARANNLSDGLRGIGISTRILSREEIVELLYYTYHKDGTGVPDAVLSDYLKTFVEGNRNPLKEASQEDKIDMILYQAQMKIRYEVMEDLIQNQDEIDYSQELFKRVEKVYEDLTESRRLFDDLEYQQQENNQNNQNNIYHDENY